MSDTVLPTPETILHLCAAAAPRPWFPSRFAREAGVPRDALDGPLDHLRMAGLVRIIDWVAGDGQGYELTQAGREALAKPRLLAKAAAGDLPPAADRADDVFARQTTAWGRGEAVRAVLDGTTPAVLTPLLLVANLAVFGLGLVLSVRAGMPASSFLTAPSDGILLQTGAMSGGSVASGQWWRLASCCFVHIGLMHLLFNLYSLYAVGPLVERMLGRWRYLTLYLLAGVGGSVTAVVNNPLVVLAGASGALWGLMGGIVGWVWLNRDHLPRQLVSDWLRQMSGVIFVNVLVSFMPGISAAAHFGGGAVGLVAVALLNWERFHTGAVRAAGVAGLVLLPVVGYAAVQSSMTRDARWQAAVERDKARVRQAEAAARERVVEGFETEYLPKVRETTVAAATLFGRTALELLAVPPAARDAGEANGVAELCRLRAGEADELAGRLRGAGPYPDGPAERARVVAAEYLSAVAVLMTLAADALETGKPGEGLADQRKKVRSAEIRWRELLSTNKGERLWR